MKPTRGAPDAATATAGSAWSPLHQRTFAVIWSATVVSNIGTWMYSTASSWLMADLAPSPLTVSLVQVAASLPMFLLALPAGALADVIDRRRLLIVVETANTAISVLFAVVVWLGLVTPVSLLLFTFLIGVGGVLSAPAWGAIVPQLVPKKDIPAAVTLEGVGFNISRAIGPALGGLIMGVWGVAAPFCINAVSNVGVVGALVWWRRPAPDDDRLPPEHVASAVWAGIRYGRNNAFLRATMIRAAGFFTFASAYWALLPLVARDRIAGGPLLYGLLLGAIGAGAVAGAFLLPALKHRLGPDRLVAAGTLGTALSMVVFGLARSAPLALAAGVVAGIAWIAVVASLNVSAQVALPEWVRGRGLALYMTVMFGAMTLGSAIWGQVAGVFGLPVAQLAAAACCVILIPLTWRWKLQTGADVDLTPSLHWAAPVTARKVDHDRGPVLVTVEYAIDPPNRADFLAALDRLAHERRRDGAYNWGVYEDAAATGRFVETFFLASWLEHLRQHQRVTNADRDLQEAVDRFHVEGSPAVSHLVAARRHDARR